MATARSESTDSTAVNLPTDVLTHTLQTMSDDEYGQVQDNYLLRHLARKTVPNHTERLAQLKPFLCEWGHMDRSEFNTKHIRVRASTEREAFLLMLRASGDHFPSILTCTTEIEIAAVIPDDQDVNETLEIFRILQSATKYEGELRRLFARTPVFIPMCSDSRLKASLLAAFTTFGELLISTTYHFTQVIYRMM